jgi:hypothetical protein
VPELTPGMGASQREGDGSKGGEARERDHVLRIVWVSGEDSKQILREFDVPSRLFYALQDATCTFCQVVP